MTGDIGSIISRLRNVKETANGWEACCPAHGDRHASLSIGTGEDGRTLLNCHAGCTPEAIVAAMGLSLSGSVPRCRHAAESRAGEEAARHAEGRGQTGRADRGDVPLS